MKTKRTIVAGVCALMLVGCGLFAAGGPAVSALEVVAPIAAKALARLIQNRYGTDVDEQTAGCYELPEFTTDEEGFEYIICRAKPIE